MSFQASSRDFFLEDGHILFANVCDREGNWYESRIDLDRFIGNQDGWFMWDGVSTYCPFPPTSVAVLIITPPCKCFAMPLILRLLSSQRYLALYYILLFDQTPAYKQLLTWITFQTSLIQPMTSVSKALSWPLSCPCVTEDTGNARALTWASVLLTRTAN